MSKFPPGYQGAVPNVDIIKLLHDEVVSLCQRSYSAVSGLEIDGIICISILDTKEQQVVKIHKTLKSVFAESNKRQKKQRNDTQEPAWLTLGNTRFPPSNQEPGPESFQNDIDALSNLLRDTNAAISKELSRTENVSKVSKRKRRQPRQRVVQNMASEGIESSRENSKSEASREEINSPHNFTEEHDAQSSPSVNPFIHKDVIKIKEEKVDPEYDAAEQTQPKIVSVSSVAESENDKIETNNVGVERKKVSSLIESIIEKEIPREKSSPETSVDNLRGTKEVTEYKNKDKECDNAEFQAIEVKVEKDTDDSEYGGSQGCDPADFTETSSNNFGTAGSNSEAESPLELFYNENASVGEVGRTALLEKLYEKGTLSHTGYPTETCRAKRDPQGRSWIEMVKDNVNKYQAALERSSRGKSEGEITAASSNSHKKASSMFTSSSSLVALLKQPTPISLKSKELTTNAIFDSVPSARGPSAPKQSSDPISDRSTSSSPVVKIEVDEDLTHEMYSHSNGDVTYKGSRSEDMSKNAGQALKVPQGKLESRYPALFSHLQQAKQTGYDSQDQPDSLVNRLPFISFQELFSQAATSAPSPRLSESATMQLLAQARINPYPSKEKSKTQRKVWNWKKRQVRPKDADGKIISAVPARVKSPDSVKKKRFLGLSTSMKKTFSKKGQKNEKEEDQDWQPDVDSVDVDSDNNDSGQINTEAASTSGRRTRLSCGDKPRINFAELENSDIEMEEEDEIEELESLRTSSLKTLMDNVNPLIYMERQEENNSVFPGGGSEKLLAAFSTSSDHFNSAGNSAAEQYKCSLCGLEFNQEYRWQYHLIKVHGITEEKVKLFR